MTDGNRPNLIVLILAVIGGVAVLGVLGTWLTHGTMMGGPMMGGGGRFIGLLILGALVVLVVVLARRRT